MRIGIDRNQVHWRWTRNLGVLIVTSNLLLLRNIWEVSGQDCQFGMRMGDKYDKCWAVCLGRKPKCVADGTCLCQTCPNSNPQSFMNTHDDIHCEWNQECSRKCMDVNTEPEYGGNIGKGKKCDFKDDFYSSDSSVCVCGCM